MARRRGVGGLTKRVAFDAPLPASDDYGGSEDGWQADNLAIKRPAEFIYQRGGEGEQHGRLSGSARFKVRIHQSVAARTITTDFRMRDVKRDIAYQIHEVDNISDDTWIYLVVESGVAI